MYEIICAVSEALLMWQVGVSASEVRQALLAKQINVSVSAAPSTRLDFEQRGLSEVVRASVHYYNTEVEIQRLLAAVATA